MDDVAPQLESNDPLAPIAKPEAPTNGKVEKADYAGELAGETIFDDDAEAAETEREMAQVERELAEIEARKEYREREKIARIPVLSAAEVEREYRKALVRAEGCNLNLAKWLPSFSRYRPLIPGDLVTIIGATGQGKTSIMATIAMKIAPQPTLIFELELSVDAIFERLVSIDRRLTGQEVEAAYRLGDGVGLKPYSHIWICPLPRITVMSMQGIIKQAELKMGMKPQVIMLDYIQLLTGKGSSRYEKTADNAEELKRIARDTGTIIVATSQRVEKRGEEYVDPEVYLHSARGASEIDNSSQMILGIWQDPETPNTMKVKVIKATRGQPGLIIECNWFPATQTLTERAKSAEEL